MLKAVPECVRGILTEYGCDVQQWTRSSVSHNNVCTATTDDGDCIVMHMRVQEWEQPDLCKGEEERENEGEEERMKRMFFCATVGNE